MTIPACAKDHCTRPEQSKDVGPSAPQTYGMPLRLIAALSMVLTADTGAAAEVTEPAPAWRELMRETSCSTPAPLGSSFPMAATSAAKSAVLTLTTIALPARPPSW